MGGEQLSVDPFDPSDDATVHFPPFGPILETEIPTLRIFRRTTDGALQPGGDKSPENVIRRDPDDILDLFGFQKLVQVRGGEARVPSKIAGNVPFAVTPDDRFENGAPVRRGGGVAGTQEAPFHVAALVEREKWVVADATGVTVVFRSLLVAVDRAAAAVDVDDGRLWRTNGVDPVDPRSVGSVKAARFSTRPRISVSKRPMWPVDAPLASAVWPPITRLMAGSSLK